MAELEQVPAEAFAGDTWTWTRELANYPASTHTATYYFERADDSFSVAATASGDAFAVTVPSATTQDRRDGEFGWFLVVTNTATSARTTVERGTLVVHADPAAAGNKDRRSINRKTLDALEAVMASKATSDQLNVSIEGHAISRMTWTELMKAHKRYKQLVAAEDNAARIAAGKPTMRRILTRMA